MGYGSGQPVPESGSGAGYYGRQDEREREDPRYNQDYRMQQNRQKDLITDTLKFDEPPQNINQAGIASNNNFKEEEYQQGTRAENPNYRQKLDLKEKEEKFEEAIKQEIIYDKNVAIKKGKSSQEEKIKILCDLMFKAESEELKFLVRSLQKSLKIGASFKTILNSLARSITKLLKNKIDEKEIYRILLASKNQLSDEDIFFGHIIELIQKGKDSFQSTQSNNNIAKGKKQDFQ